jgi:hypothetical protein
MAATGALLILRKTQKILATHTWCQGVSFFPERDWVDLTGAIALAARAPKTRMQTVTDPLAVVPAGSLLAANVARDVLEALADRSLVDWNDDPMRTKVEVEALVARAVDLLANA